MASDLLTLEDQISAKHAALLVVDMQNDFCAEGGYLHRKYQIDVAAREKLGRNIMTLVEGFRAAGGPVVWIAASYDLENLSASYRARTIKHRDGEFLCLEGS